MAVPMRARKYTFLIYFLQDIALNGWQLKHTAGDKETVYKFHRNKLAAGHFLTVSTYTMFTLETNHNSMLFVCLNGETNDNGVPVGPGKNFQGKGFYVKYFLQRKVTMHLWLTFKLVSIFFTIILWCLSDILHTNDVAFLTFYTHMMLPFSAICIDR